MTSIEICLQYYRKRNAAAAVITSILMPNTKQKKTKQHARLACLKYFKECYNRKKIYINRVTHSHIKLNIKL